MEGRMDGWMMLNKWMDNWQVDGWMIFVCMDEEMMMIGGHMS